MAIVKRINSLESSGEKATNIRNAIKAMMDGIDESKAVKAMHSLGMSIDDIRDKTQYMHFDAEKVDDAISLLGSNGVKSTDKLGSALSGLAAKFGALSAATKLFLGVAAGIAVIYTGVQIYNAHVQELVDNANEAATVFASSKSSIESYANRVDELRISLDSGTLSEEQAYQAKAELLSIQQELTASYEDEVAGIDLVNGEIENQIDLIKQLNAVNADRFLNENHTAINKAERELGKNRKYSIGRISLASSGEDVDALNNILGKYDEYLTAVDAGDGLTQTIVFEGNAENASEVLNSLMSDLRDASSEFENSSIINSFMSSTSEQINAADEVLENYLNIVEQAKIATLVADKKTYARKKVSQSPSEWLEDYTKAIQAYNDALASGDASEIEKAAADFASVDASVQSLIHGSGMSVYADIFNKAAEQLDTATIAHNQFIDAVTGSGNINGKNYSLFANALKDSGLTDVDFKYAVNTDGAQEGEDAINSLIFAAKEAGVISGESEEEIQKLVDILIEAGILIGNVSEEAQYESGILHKSYDELSAAVASAVEVQKSANEIFSDNTYITEEAYNSIVEFIGGENALADCIDTNNGYLITNAKALNKLIDASNEALQKNVKLSKSHEKLKYHELTKQLKDVVSNMGDYNDASMDTVRSLLDQIDTTELQIAKYSLLEQQLLGVTNAFTEMAEAQSVDEAADYTDDLSDMIESLFTSFENKEFGTETFWTAFKAIVPEDVYGQFEDVADQIDAGWKYLNNTIGKYYFKDDSTVSIDFDNVESFVKYGLKKAYGDSTVFTGTLESFELNDSIKTIEDLADAIGVTTTVAFAMGSAISKYSADNADFFASLDAQSLEGQIYLADQELVKLLEHQAELGESGKIGTDEWNKTRENIHKASADLDNLATQSRKDIIQHIELDSNISEAQKTVDDLYTKLQEMDESNPEFEATMSDYLVAEQHLAKLLADKYQLELPTELTIQVALEQVQNEIDAAQNKLDEIATFDGKTYTAVAGIEQDEVDALLIKLEGLRNEQSNIEMYAGINDEDVLNSLETIQNYSIDDKNFSVTAKLGNTVSRLRRVTDILDDIVDKTITVTADVKDGSKYSTKNYYRNKTDKLLGIGEFAGKAHVRGHWGIKSAEKDSLVGELGPEIYVDPKTGVYQTVGENGAEFVDLPRNAIIFNHKQTEGLLKNKRINSRGKAYLNGNAHFTLVDYKSPASKAKGSTTSGKGVDSDLEVFDWIEIAISRIEDVVDRLKTTATSAYKALKTKLGATYDGISKVNEQIAIQQRAYDRYMKEANNVGLSSDLVSLVQSGAIDISQYDEETQKLIEDYQEWHEKALNSAKALDTLYEDRSSMYVDNFDNIKADYDGQIELLEHEADSFQSGIDKLEEEGYLRSASYYIALQENARKNIGILNQELTSLEQSLSEAMASGEIEEGSEAWYTMKSSINGVKNSIDEANLSLTKYSKTLHEIEWEHFDYTQERISRLTEESNFMIDLMSNSDLYNDGGKLTDEGMATMGLHAQNYNTYMAQADQYAAEILELNKLIAEDPNNTKLIARKEELIGLQHDSILAAEDEKKAMIDMVREGIDLELESLKALIDTYTDALDSAKDLYEYQKKIKDHTSEITSIQKQLSAYENDLSEETRATVQKLTVELAKAEDELAETEWERQISEQKKMLDMLYEEYSLVLNERLDNTDALLEEMIGSINSNADSINSTLTDTADDVGYTMSESMQSIWNGSTEALDGTLSVYGDGFNKKLTAINSVLNQIQANTAAMITNSDDQAKEDIKEETPAPTPEQNKPVDTPQEKPNQDKNKTEPPKTEPQKDKTIKVGGKINAKGAKIYSYAGDKSGNKQFFSKDPIYTVLGESNGYLKVRHHKLSSGVTGWFKKKDVKAYKTGGLVDYTGLAQLDGTPTKPELVLNAQDTANFIALKETLQRMTEQGLSIGNSYGGEYVPQFSGLTDISKKLATIRDASGLNSGVNVGDIQITIPIDHVEDYNDFTAQLQKDKQFERFVQSITVDRLVDRPSLNKNRHQFGNR